MNLNKFFNSFIYQTSKKQNNEGLNHLTVKNSVFSYILNSAIHFSSDIKFENEIFSEQQIVINDINISNCCFQNCKTFQPYSNGGALNLETFHLKVDYQNTIFSKCTSEGVGGAISSNCASFIGISCIFSECISKETGMAIFYNMNKRDGSPWPKFELSQTSLSNNQGKFLLLDLDCQELRCKYTNMTNNQNNEFNSLSSVNQNCVVISFLCRSWGNEFGYINMIGNNGDYLVSIDEKPNGDYNYVNIIGNYNLNYFFQFYGNESIIHISYFAFFNNYPKLSSQKIVFSNKIVSKNFFFSNCTFDLPENQVSTIFYNITANDFIFDQQLIDCGIGNAFTFDEVPSYFPPSRCFIQKDEISFDSNCSIKNASYPTFSEQLPQPSISITSITQAFTTHTPSQTSFFTSIIQSKTQSSTQISNSNTITDIFNYSTTPTQSKKGQKISFTSSYIQTYVKKKSVSLSHSISLINTNSMSFNNEVGEISRVLIETESFVILPYIIYIYSQTNVPTMVLFEFKENRKKITSERLIGIVCGSVAAVFSIIGVAILFLNRKNIPTHYSDLISDDSSEEYEITKTDISFSNTLANEDDNWLQFF